MTYPPMKWFDNEFLPGQPPPAALQISADNLGKLSDGKTTCVSGPAPTGCTADSGRANGCDCGHSWQCKSSWCEDAICKDTIGSFKCKCKTGFAGDGVQCDPLFEEVRSAGRVAKPASRLPPCRSVRYRPGLASG